jgi:hypothetical protein
MTFEAGFASARADRVLGGRVQHQADVRPRPAIELRCTGDAPGAQLDRVKARVEGRLAKALRRMSMAVRNRG